MQVLMFGWEFPPRISGGLGTACYGLTQALTGLGHGVIFVTPRCYATEGNKPVPSSCFSAPCRPFEVSPARKGLTLLTIPSALMPYKTGLDGSFMPVMPCGGPFPKDQDIYGADPIGEAKQYGRTAGFIAGQHSFDVIHAHDWMSVFAGIEARTVSGRPLVLHIHSLEFDRSGENVNQDIYDIERFGLEAADRIVAVSHYTRRIIIDRYGVDPAKIDVIHNAVIKNDSASYAGIRRERERQVVLFLGRITYQKGPDYFIEAASRVLREMPDVLFIMAGEGDLMPQMAEKVENLGMGANFHFTGFLTAQEVERIYRNSDLYVMPSVSEPFGIAPLEAVCHDLPVIISRQSGVSEILNNVIKVDYWNVSEMADYIVAVLQCPALRTLLAAGARKELKRIHWKKTAAEILKVYRSIIHVSK